MFDTLSSTTTLQASLGESRVGVALLVCSQNLGSFQHPQANWEDIGILQGALKTGQVMGLKW